MAPFLVRTNGGRDTNDRRQGCAGHGTASVRPGVAGWRHKRVRFALVGQAAAIPVAIAEVQSCTA